MKEKKKLAGWQFGVLLGLLVLFMCTMFIPLYQWNDNVAKKYAENFIVFIKEQNEDNIENYCLKLAQKEWEDLLNEIINDDNDFDTHSISPLYLMTHSFTKFWFGKKWSVDNEKYFLEEKKEEDILTPAYHNKNWKTFKIFLIVIYVLDFAVIILTILGFCLKWNKIIIPLFNSVYGGLSLLLFLVYRIVSNNGISIYIAKCYVSEVFEREEDIERITSTINWGGPLFSVGFIFAISIAFVLLAFGVVCIFVGGTPAITGKEGGGISIDDDPPFIPYTPPTPPIPEPIIPPAPIVPPQPVTPPPAPFPVQPEPVPVVGKVMCTKGVAFGQGFQLPVDRKVIVGKSPSKANLVINNQNVSNLHCSIRFNAAHNSYIIKDHSTNGTFVNGVRLPADTPVEYPAGTILSLADGTNEITLG